MYPLKFQPIFQHRIWGGQRLRTVLNKAVPRELERQPVGESWELADLPAGTVKADSKGAAADGSLSSVVVNGPWAGRTLAQVLRNSEFRIQNSESGKGAGGHFPLLIKFLDAQEDLSVQVHPDGAYCKAHPGSHLKSESWYIMYAEPGAKIYKGVKAGVTREAFRAALEKGEVEPLLNAIKVRAGDCHYLPSGTVHALGAGILAAEVQTPSDTTFRVFDWNRLGPDGKGRALHIEQALECIDFGAAPGAEPMASGSLAGQRLVANEYFTLDRVQLPQGDVQAIGPEMAIWIILEGQGVVTCGGVGPTAFARGDTLLLPASMKNGKVQTIANCTWLEAKVPGRGVA